MSEKPETVTIKVYYGTDPQGFYWAGSAQKKKEMLDIKRNDPAGFEAVYQGRPGRRIGTIFLTKDFDYYLSPDGLENGIVEPQVREFCREHQIFQAWDTAFSTSSQSAYTVCVTGLFVACDQFHCGENPLIVGECENHYDVIILDVFRDKLDWGALPTAVRREYHKWHPETVLIEKRATGISLVQTMPAAGVPVLGIEVGSSSKGERAINKVDGRGAGSVQGWCRQHRVKFPDKASWYDNFVKELKDFDGEGNSSSDQVDSFVHLVTHAIRLSCGVSLLPSGFTYEAADGGYPKELNGQTVDSFLQYVGDSLIDSDDPFSGMCGRCQHYEAGFCAIQRRSVVMLDSCFEYEDRVTVSQ